LRWLSGTRDAGRTIRFITTIIRRLGPTVALAVLRASVRTVAVRVAVAVSVSVSVGGGRRGGDGGRSSGGGGRCLVGSL
jgi:hypothetical protein